MNYEPFWQRIAAKWKGKPQTEPPVRLAAHPPRRITRVKKTHCLRGHERTPENIRPGGACRTCHLERARLQRIRERTVAK
jgi:hypothetical protein